MNVAGGIGSAQRRGLKLGPLLAPRERKTRPEMISSHRDEHRQAERAGRNGRRREGSKPEGPSHLVARFTRAWPRGGTSWRPRIHMRLSLSRALGSGQNQLKHLACCAAKKVAVHICSASHSASDGESVQATHPNLVVTHPPSRLIAKS